MRTVILSVLMMAATSFSAQDTQSRYTPQDYVTIKNADWTKNATIYELNVRQFSKEGNFKAVEKELLRLKKMGIDIIWLMPVNPIGEVNRKGSLGSYYSVKNYLEINPEFGTEKDFRDLVKAIHQQGMFVIIDWVANHSAWDNPLVKAHPEWYLKNREGNFQPTPWRDYDDIIEFDYSNPELRRYMTDAMKFWVKNYDIDGFRCDVAAFVPLDFWENVRAELEEIKPVFMLAEASDRDLHRKAFDATYAWELYDKMHQVIKNKSSVTPMTEGYFAEHLAIFPKEGMRMTFTDNHDKNSWEGTMQSNFGNGLEAAIVLAATFDGIPMVYSGQEAGLSRSLKFFEKDPIDWKKHRFEEIYTKLFALKHKNRALWNGSFGGKMERIKSNHMEQSVAFVREKYGDKVLVFINFSDKPQDFIFETDFDKGTYTNLFTNKIVALPSSFKLKLAPWEYLVLHNSRD